MTRGTFTFFVGPSVFIMLALMTLPLLASIVLGLHYITFRNLDAPVWIGLQNYQEVLADPEFWDSLEFTLLFIVATVPLRIVLGLILLVLDAAAVRLSLVHEQHVGAVADHLP